MFLIGYLKVVSQNKVKKRRFISHSEAHPASLLKVCSQIYIISCNFWSAKALEKLDIHGKNMEIKEKIKVMGV